jgi:hypothetical protein
MRPRGAVLCVCDCVCVWPAEAYLSCSNRRGGQRDGGPSEDVLGDDRAWSDLAVWNGQPCFFFLFLASCAPVKKRGGLGEGRTGGGGGLGLFVCACVCVGGRKVSVCWEDEGEGVKRVCVWGGVRRCRREWPRRPWHSVQQRENGRGGRDFGQIKSGEARRTACTLVRAWVRGAGRESLFESFSKRTMRGRIDREEGWRGVAGRQTGRQASKLTTGGGGSRQTEENVTSATLAVVALPVRLPVLCLSVSP